MPCQSGSLNAGIMPSGNDLKCWHDELSYKHKKAALRSADKALKSTMSRFTDELSPLPADRQHLPQLSLNWPCS